MLNTYPCNPFPPSTDQMDADTLEANVSKLETDVDQLKSGLTNVDVALSVPEGSGKNIIPMSLSGMKAVNTSGTWNDNAYTVNDVTFTVQTDSDGNVTNITVNGTATQNADLLLCDYNTVKSDSYILSGCPSGGSVGTYFMLFGTATQRLAEDIGAGDTFNIASSVNARPAVRILSGYAASNLVFYPMIRPATITDPTFAPYIPSVESRIEAVESGVANINTELNGKRIRYDGGTAWPGTSLEFTVSKGNDFAYHFVAIASTANDTTSQSGYLVIRNDGTVLIVDQIGSFTASYNGTTGVLTITLPSSGYWDYRLERVASRLG